MQSVPARHSPGYDRVKPGRFHHHRGGADRDTRLLATKNSCQAHRGTAVGNYLVLGMQSALYAVQRGELLSSISPANGNLALHRSGVKAVKRVSKRMHHVVAGVDQCVNRIQSSGPESLLNRFGRSLAA